MVGYVDRSSVAHEMSQETCFTSIQVVEDPFRELFFLTEICTIPAEQYRCKWQCLKVKGIVSFMESRRNSSLVTLPLDNTREVDRSFGKVKIHRIVPFEVLFCSVLQFRFDALCSEESDRRAPPCCIPDSEMDQPIHFGEAQLQKECDEYIQ